MASPGREVTPILFPLKFLFRPFQPDMRPLLVSSLIFLVSLFLWMVLVLFHFFDGQPQIGPARPWLGTIQYRVTLVGFLIAQTAFWGRVFTSQEKFDVIDRLWRLFSVGMLCVSGVLMVVFGERLSGQAILRPYFMGFLFCVGLYAFTVFFVGAVFTYQRFILYPRTKKKAQAWNAYLALLGLGLVFVFANDPLGISFFRVFAYLLLIVLVVYLILQLRWVSYLNFSMKLRAVGLLFLLLLIQTSLLFAAYLMPWRLGVEFHKFFGLEFFHFLVALSVGYSASSLLVLFFSLPASSLFEQKSFEIASFNKIHHAIQSNLDFSDIMDTLLNVCLYTSDARGGWVEMWDQKTGTSRVQIAKRIAMDELSELRPGADLIRRLLKEKNHLLVRNLRRNREFRVANSRFRSLLAVPVYSGSDAYGVIFLVTEPANGFEEFTIQSVKAYAEQTAVSLENARLVSESIENERFREQFKIAKEVQEGLLPAFLPQSDCLEFAAQAQSAYEVGGDYYDILQASPELFRIAIGDVSGKGTQAAFYMAEVKGIFQALGQLDLGVKGFILNANRALARCLQRGSFVTLSYLEINTRDKTVELMRAGHCPTFLIRAGSREVVSIKEGTLGLGILRDQRFDALAGEPTRIRYASGDVLMLYTDGIPEARNQEGEEFGYQRIETVLKDFAGQDAASIVQQLVGQVEQFARREMHDDFTVLVIRFKA